MKAFITGGAGFVGSNLSDRLLQKGHEVTIFDNFSTGQLRFLENAQSLKTFKIVEGDILNIDALKKAIEGHEIVFHLAANADVRFGTKNPSKDLEQNTIGTHNVLEAMRNQKICKIAFASTGSVYGEANIIPTPENAPFPIQTSFYAASKLACEGLISAYCEGFGFQSWIFRFVSILGERYTHGHIFDFYKKLKIDSKRLEILGDGNQQKSYLYIHDCIDAMLLTLAKSSDSVNIFNIGLDESCKVKESVSLICEALGLNPKLKFSGGKRGWIGDNPFILLETRKLQSLGWKPKFSISESVLKTLEFLKENEWVFERRNI